MGNNTRAAQQGHRNKLGIRGVRTVEGGAAFEFRLIHHWTLMQGVLAIEAGRPVSQEIEAGARWVLKCLRTAPGSNALCLTCDYEFGRGKSPPVFYSMVRGENAFAVTGVCATCAQGKSVDEMSNVAAKFYRSKVFGGDLTIRSAAEGHA